MTIPENAMAPHSSTLAWKMPWMEEPGRLQSTGSLRVGHNWATSLSRIGEGNGNPLQCSCLENPGDGGAWWAAVYGVAQSRTRLKWLSSLAAYIWKVLNKLLEGNVDNYLKMFFQFARNHCQYTPDDFWIWKPVILKTFENNKVLLCSTGNYIQYPVINHNGKEY